MLSTGTYWLLKDLTPLLLTLEQFETSTYLNTYVSTTVSKNSSGLLNYVPYVLSCLTCLVPYVHLCPVFSCLTCPVYLVRYQLSCLLPYVLSCLMCLLPYVPCVLRASCQTCSGILHVLRAVVSHVSCVFLGCSWLEHYVLLCSSSLTCFRCFKPNMLLCISCLVAFMSCASCTFVDLAI